MNFAVILAGGIGSRFWPLSSATQPKQFLNLFSKRPLLTESLDRLGHLIDKNKIYIATNKIYRKSINACTRRSGIPSKNFLFEPQGKNTFAPIAILSSMICNKDKDAIIMALPSDHFIKDKNKFIRALKGALGLAKAGYIVTLGIAPDRPEAGYGYIKVNSKLKTQNSKVFNVERFIEKPDLEKAKKFAKDKRFYWNSGIFIFQAKTFLEEVRRYVPGVYQILTKIKDKKDLKRYWFKLPSISIDYAIMEKTKKLALVPLSCGWSDLGSWKAIEEIMQKDKNGNIFRGKHIDLGSRNTTVWTEKRLVATIGLRDIIIVDTDRGLLVCHKDKAQDVKKITQALKNK